MSSLSSYDFGACSNPGISYDSSQAIFTPSNFEQFPFESSDDIAILESAICDRLRSDECDAGLDAIIACDGARWLYSGYAGQAAADAWNEALRVDGSGEFSDETVTTAARDPLVSSTTVLVSPVPSSTSIEEEASSSSSDPSSIRTLTTTPAPQPTSTLATTTRTTVSTAQTTSNSNNDYSSNGSPFGYQNGASTSIPRKSLTTTTRVLGLLTTLILLFTPPLH